MSRPSALDLATVVGAVVVAGALTLLQGAGLPELVFYSVMLTLLARIVQLLVRSVLTAHREHKRAAQLAALRPADAALAAVRDERRRLSLEIAASLRDALEQVRADASAAEIGPGLDMRLRRIHETTQEATSELRRHLGLLRSPLPEAELAAPSGAERLARSDVALAIAMAVLGVLESIAYGLTEESIEWSIGSVPATALAAATVLGRRVALGGAALACAAVFGVGSLVGAPVTEGLWTLGTVGVLVWAVAARGRNAADLLGGALLVVVAALTRVLDSPDNVQIMVVVLAVSISGGLVVRLSRAGAQRAARHAELRERELSVARQAAVDAERRGFARELHDVASHAIGVIAMQAGAAELSWRRDPEGARRNLAVLRDTADAALEELGRMHPSEGPRTMTDVAALVERIRATGTSVDLTVEGEVAPQSAHVVHRIVQEALTNALRHAPGARVLVEVRSDSARTTVTVTDDGPGPGPADSRGYGLVGLAERVKFAGGTFALGSAPDGTPGFRVVANLPAPADQVLS